MQWENIDVKRPPVKFISKDPLIVMCPVCSMKFDSRTYRGGHEIFVQMEQDYDKHFAEKHSAPAPPGPIAYSKFTEWFQSLSLRGKIQALALVYSFLTGRRELFLPDTALTKDRIISILHGIDELHHTVSNRLLDYAWEDDSYPVEAFVETLTEIATQFRIESLLTHALEFPQTRDDPPK